MHCMAIAAPCGGEEPSPYLLGTWVGTCMQVGAGGAARSPRPTRSQASLLLRLLHDIEEI